MGPVFLKGRIKHDCQTGSGQTLSFSVQPFVRAQIALHRTLGENTGSAVTWTARIDNNSLGREQTSSDTYCFKNSATHHPLFSPGATEILRTCTLSGRARAPARPFPWRGPDYQEEIRALARDARCHR